MALNNTSKLRGNLGLKIYKIFKKEKLHPVKSRGKRAGCWSDIYILTSLRLS